MLNPHSVIPPISPDRKRFHRPESHPNPNKYVIEGNNPFQNDRQGIHFTKYLPKESGTYLPRTAVTLDKQDELALRKNIREELDRYDPNKLRDIYIELTGFDSHLTGLLQFQQVSFCLMKNMVR